MISQDFFKLWIYIYIYRDKTNFLNLHNWGLITGCSLMSDSGLTINVEGWSDIGMFFPVWKLVPLMTLQTFETTLPTELLGLSLSTSLTFRCSDLCLQVCDNFPSTHRLFLPISKCIYIYIYNNMQQEVLLLNYAGKYVYRQCWDIYNQNSFKMLTPHSILSLAN